MTYNTGNPVPSTDARDFVDNCENLDSAVNSLAPTFQDRKGVTRSTYEGVVQGLSFFNVGTFAVGFTLTNSRQTLTYDGHEYGWSGGFPKDVTAGSTPTPLGSGGWIDRSDVTLRGDIEPSVIEALRRSYAVAGLNLVDGSFEEGGTLTSSTDVLLHKATGKAYAGAGPFPQTVAADANPLTGSFTEATFLFNKFNAADYGLKEGNTGLQNCKALQALTAAVNAAGGGKVYFPSGVYTVGAQTFAGATGKGYAYQPEQMFSPADLTKPLSIEFDGVVFKFADGLRYGSFDPVTGEPIVTTLPYYVMDSTAQTGIVISISNCPSVFITGSLEIDGRDTTRIIGGLWGDKGRQLIEYGMRIAHCRVYTISGAFHFHHTCLDGLYLGNRVDDDCVGSVTGVVSLYNGRQALSIAGGRSLTFNSCTFGYTGFGAVESSPGASVDLEPELYPLRGVVFNNCRLLRSKGASLVAEDFNSRGVVFNDCLIENSDNVSIYNKVSNMKFNRCTIRGKVEPCHPGTHSGQGLTGVYNVNAYPEFNDCHFYNKLEDGTSGYSYPTLMNVVIAKINNCTMFADLDGTNNLAILADHSKVDGLRIVVTGTVKEEVSAFAYFRNHKGIRDLYVENNTTTTSGGDPAITARIEVGSGSDGRRENLFIEKSDDGFDNILWESSYRASARSGNISDNKAVSATASANGLLPAYQQIGLAKHGYPIVDYYKPQLITSDSALPTSGNFNRGDIIINSDPSPSGAFGWMCTTSGAAGSTAVFKIITNIGA